MSKTEVRLPGIPSDWIEAVGAEFSKPYFHQLKEFLLDEKKQGFTLYPPSSKIFEAFNRTAFNQVRVVILGQDPYHGPGQAHGLCFSVPPGIPRPPSLQNICKEILADTGSLSLPRDSGDLSAWADQGVFLLNTTLTVRAGLAGSHQHQGWEVFTDKVIETLGREKSGLVFMLWGKFAIDKSRLIPPSRHLILTAPHPSPLSAHRGFLGCRHFSQANAYLTQQGLPGIVW